MPRRSSTPRHRSSYARTVKSVYRRGRTGKGKVGSFLKTGIIGDTTQALGASMLVGSLVSKVAAPYAPVAALGAGYLAGGWKGAVVGEVVKHYLMGAPSVLGGLSGLIPSLGGSGNGPVNAPSGDVV